MKAGFAIAALTAACLSTFAAAQMGQGMGPGMMHGQGMGPGMTQGQGMGPGMMHGQGMGPGMMQGQHGMMGGRGMGGGMHAAMPGGLSFAAIEALGLTDDQRAKVTEIRRDMQRKSHALMGATRELRWKSQDAAKAAEFDAAAARKRYDEGAAIRKQMFEARLEARTKIEAVLTKEQREQLGKSGRPGVPG